MGLTSVTQFGENLTRILYYRWFLGVLVVILQGMTQQI
jgi:hypothetical protein